MNEFEISNILKDLGVAPGQFGYNYLKYAIKLVLDDNSLANKISTGLYPKIAEHFDTTYSRVERAIRHSIDAAWLDTSSDMQYVVFRNTVRASKGRPTNGVFIATVADYLMSLHAK